MRKFSLFPFMFSIFAGIAMAGFAAPASAQAPMPQSNMPTKLDCSTALDSVEYYCSHRDEFDKDGKWTGPKAAAGAPAASQGPAATTGSARRPVRRTQPQPQ
jgi:hypothetical protein